MTDKHEHQFIKLGIVNIKADAPEKRNKKYDFAGYGVTLPHFGELRPMALLVWQCECKAYRAFEMGTRKDITELARRVKHEQNQRAILQA